MTKLFWEDFSEGSEFDLGEYFLSQEELIEFAKQYDPQDFHTDPIKALDSPLGQLCATGIQTMAICQRLLVTQLFNRTAFVAGVNMGNMSFSRPVLPNEALRAELTVTTKRRLSDGKRGLLSYEMRAFNPRDECVLTTDASVILLCRNEASDT